jgi:hypothetical protein
MRDVSRFYHVTTPHVSPKAILKGRLSWNASGRTSRLGHGARCYNVEEPMKTTAIVCIILGVVVAGVGISMVEREREDLRLDARAIGMSDRQFRDPFGALARQLRLEREAGELTWWTPIIAGVAVSAFGVLILAIVSRPTTTPTARFKP